MTPDPAEEIASAAPSSERQSSGWDIRNAPKNYFWLIVFQFASAAAAFVSVWLITRPQYLGKEGYGSVMAVIVASHVALVFVSWTAISVIRFGIDEFVETASIARTFWTRFLILAANLVVMLALATLWYQPLADWMRLSPSSFWLVIAYFTISSIWLHVQQGLQAAKMLRAQGMMVMLERVLTLMGLVALVATQALEFKTAVICYIASQVVMLIAGVFKLRPVIFSRFTFRKEDVRKILAYSLPLLPYGLVGYFSGSYLDAVFISKFLSTADLGVYSLAIQINSIAMQVPTLANTLLLPLLVTLQAESGKERSFTYFRSTLPSLVLLWGLACSLLAFACYFLIPLIFSVDFAPATVPIWILLSATVIWIPIAIGYSALASSTSATYIPTIVVAASSSANVAANFLLIPRYGMIGCAIATLIAFTASVVTFAVLLKRKAKMPVSWTFVASIPCVSGTAVLLVFDSPVLALATSVAATAILAVIKRASLVGTFAFFAGLAKNSRRA